MFTLGKPTVVQQWRKAKHGMLKVMLTDFAQFALWRKDVVPASNGQVFSVAGFIGCLECSETESMCFKALVLARIELRTQGPLWKLFATSRPKQLGHFAT